MLSLFRKPHKTKIELLLDSAPGPSPWYLNTSKPAFSTMKFGQAYWKRTEKGEMLLEAANNSILAICDFYQFIKPISDESFLHWHQLNSTSILLSFYDLNMMSPICDPNITLHEISEKKIGFCANGGLVSSVNILTTDVDNVIELNFPAPINQQDELLILANSPVVQGVGRVIVIAKPSQGICYIYPQDWFNQGDFDFGYQWITRVARDPETGRIVGDGIRLGQFMLDMSLRNLDRWILKKV